MLEAERLFSNFEGLRAKRFGFCVIFFGAIQLFETHEAGGHVGVIGAEYFLPNIYRAGVKHFRFIVAAFLLIEIGEICEWGDQVGMIWSQRFFARGERLLQKILRVDRSSKRAIIQREIIGSGGYANIIRRICFSPDRERSFVKRQRFGKFSFAAIELGFVV